MKVSKNFDYEKKVMYLCIAKKERDGLCHQQTKVQTGH